MAALTSQEVKDYLGIDFADEVTERLIARLIVVSDGYLKGSIGIAYPSADERAKQLALLVISDLYDNRENTEKVSANVRRLVVDFSMQLRVELMPGAV